MDKQLTESEQKKKYLWGYRDAVRQMERSELKIREMRLNKMLPSVVGDGMPHAHNNSDLSRYAALLDQEERRYMKARYLRIRKCKEITDRIEQMKDEDEKDVLFFRYIKLMKWEDIAQEMEFADVRQIYNIHGDALKNFII